MDTLLSSDQLELESYCQKLLENEWPLEKAIKTFGPGGSRHSPELLKTLAEAGWLGMPFAEEYGGAGADFVDLGLVYRACGEYLVPSSFYSCMFAALAIDAIATEAQKQSLLTKIISGQILATVAQGEPHAVEETRLFKAKATQVGSTWVFKGSKAFVADLGTADVVLVLARIHDVSEYTGWGMFAVETSRLQGRIRASSAFGNVPLFRLDLEDLEVPFDALLGGTAAIATTLERFDEVMEKVTALQCMEMTGGITAILNRTVAYMKEREQFGRPIGTNQAVQHMLADISIHLDGARVAALKALFLKSRGRPAAKAVSMAKVMLGEGYVNATITAQQLWGSMGYARETGLYHWTERAKVTDIWHGTRNSHLRRVATLMGL